MVTSATVTNRLGSDSTDPVSLPVQPLVSVATAVYTTPGWGVMGKQHCPPEVGTLHGEPTGFPP